VETLLKERWDFKPADLRLAAQISEGSPGLAMELDLKEAVEKRRAALRLLERAAQGQGFSQLFAETSVLAKDRESPFEDLLAIFYSLFTDLLEITSGTKSPSLRNPQLSKELTALAAKVTSEWVMQAIGGIDEIAAGARRNLNRQLGLDAFAASLSQSAHP
jgi:hypothetical protein